jgi:glycosyltransferase involved in cell wall biosynthesis
MRILWLKNELLHPVDKGGKIRTYNMLKRLRRGHTITYLTLAPRNLDPVSAGLADEYCDRLIPIGWQSAGRSGPGFYFDLARNMGSAIPYSVQKYRTDRMRQAIRSELSANCYDLLVCDFLTPSINVPRPLPIPSLLFQHNVESSIWRRHYENEDNKLRKAYFYTQWRRMIAYERSAVHWFDSVVAVSSLDRDFMQREYGANRVYDVPTGVDTEYFRPAGVTPDPAGLVFCGSMDWMPNEDAVTYFLTSILPAIAAKVPAVNVTIVGRNPSSRLRALAGSYSRVTVTGAVADIRSYVDRASCYVVPIRIGGGTRLKIFEGMAMGKPVVSTSVGAEGLPLSPGEDLLLADNPDAFAAAVVRILSDRPLAQRLAARGRAGVCARFGWDNAAGQFAEICERTVLNVARSRAA